MKLLYNMLTESRNCRWLIAVTLCWKGDIYSQCFLELGEGSSQVTKAEMKTWSNPVHHWMLLSVHYWPWSSDSPQFLWHNQDDRFSSQSQFSENISCCNSSSDGLEGSGSTQRHADLALAQLLLCAGSGGRFSLTVRIQGLPTQELLHSLQLLTDHLTNRHKTQPVWKDTSSERIFLIHFLKCNSTEFLNLNSDSELRHQIAT